MERLDMPEHLLTDRLLLQRLRYEDAEEIFYCYASKPEATRFVSFPTHDTIRTTREYLRYVREAWNKGVDFSYSIRLKDNGQLIGSYGIINEVGKIQFGYILGPNHWQQGFATEACTALTKLLQVKKMIYRIGTYVDCDNTTSVKVLEKCGYIREARLRNWMRFPNQGNQPKDCWVYVLPQE